MMTVKRVVNSQNSHIQLFIDLSIYNRKLQLKVNCSQIIEYVNFRLEYMQETLDFCSENLIKNVRTHLNSHNKS